MSQISCFDHHKFSALTEAGERKELNRAVKEEGSTAISPASKYMLVGY